VVKTIVLTIVLTGVLTGVQTGVLVTIETPLGSIKVLDFGGARAADGQGFAAFGRVVNGMDVVRRIQSGATNDREQLLQPVTIVRITRR